MDPSPQFVGFFVTFSEGKTSNKHWPTEMEKAISTFKQYLISQGIPIFEAEETSLQEWTSTYGRSLPKDFQDFYRAANGMMSLYPNYSDKEGFLWYPIEVVEPIKVRGSNPWKAGESDVYEFADYLSSCWWYGFRLAENDLYEIGLVPTPTQFIPITKSLAHFIELYVADASALYPP